MPKVARVHKKHPLEIEFWCRKCGKVAEPDRVDGSWKVFERICPCGGEREMRFKGDEPLPERL